MSEQTVYDLGELRIGPERPEGTGSRPAPHAAPATGGRGFVPPLVQRREPLDLQGTLSLVLPGSEQLLLGEVARGLAYMTGIAFLACLFWATLETMTRLTATLDLFGFPRELASWTLGVIYGTAALLHLGCVASIRHAGCPVAPHAAVPAVASALLPGWGQVLNGDRRRAAAFLGGLWLVGAAWILVSGPAREMLATNGFHLPVWLQVFSSPAVRWTLPAVVWTLAVYDAASRAASRR